MGLEAMAGLSAALAEAVARVGPSVVRVEGRKRPASGVVLAADAVVTAAHSLEQDELQVGLADGRTAAAELIGRDSATDLALLRVAGGGLVPAPWVDDAGTAAARVGELVLAVSRPGRTARAALGVLSAASDGEWRSPGGGLLARYLETDVALRPGFSGSALVDSAGRVIGLDTAGLMRGHASAIPATTVRRVAQALLQHGGIPRGYLGVSTLPARLPLAIAQQSGQPGAVLVAAVDPDGPAGKAGLLLGDALITINGHALQHPGELLEVLDEASVGKQAQLQILRAGELRDISITVGKRGESR